MQIIVLGMHRSGTSAVTRLVNMLGVYLGDESELIGQNPENPKGFWERRDVIDINDALLAAHGCNWFDLAKWPLDGAEGATPALSADLSQRMATLTASLDTHGIWAIKDPRLCHTLPYWLPHLKDVRLICVYRHPLEIAESLRKRNAHPLPYGLALWEYAASSMANLAQKIPALHLHYADVIERPVALCEQMLSWLNEQGAKNLSMPSVDAINDFVEPSLYRSKINDDMEMSDAQRALMESPDKPASFSSAARNYIAAHAPMIAKLEALLEMEERLGRAEDLIGAQEARITELLAESAQAQDVAHRLKIDVEAQRAAIEKLTEERDSLTARLGETEAELDAIKQTRLWRLREKLVG